MKRSVRKLTVVDLFAGCGGLSLGLEQAGFDTLAFSELNRDAANTFAMNRADKDVRRFGDIAELLRNDGEAIRQMKQEWALAGVPRIDLVAGGPPCQGYSGIGHRRSYKVEKQDVPSNHLYKDMIGVIKQFEPRMFLFENVKGIMTGRWTADGTPGEIFQDVLSAFKTFKVRGKSRYIVRHALVHARAYGVPQNRPRVLIVGFHEDLNWTPRRDSESAVEAGMLPEGDGNYPDLRDLLGDLIDPDYLVKGETTTYPRPAKKGSLAAKLRIPRKQSKRARLTEQEYSRHSERVYKKFKAMIESGGRIPEEYRTKKFAQRLLPAEWGPSGPTITATSLPDDFVHWAQPRILTVREWARLQTFPDWYQFAGPRTTGGLRRAGKPTEGIWDREVPKYTQIGNAVPVKLAEAVGEHLGGILREHAP